MKNNNQMKKNKPISLVYHSFGKTLSVKHDGAVLIVDNLFSMFKTIMVSEFGEKEWDRMVAQSFENKRIENMTDEEYEEEESGDYKRVSKGELVRMIMEGELDLEPNLQNIDLSDTDLQNAELPAEPPGEELQPGMGGPTTGGATAAPGAAAAATAAPGL